MMICKSLGPRATHPIKKTPKGRSTHDLTFRVEGNAPRGDGGKSRSSQTSETIFSTVIILIKQTESYGEQTSMAEVDSWKLWYLSIQHEILARQSICRNALKGAY